MKRFAHIVLLPMLAWLGSAQAQPWDLPARGAEALTAATGVKLTFEWRDRYESRTGTSFGAAPGIDTGLERTRLGLTWSPARWLKLSGMAQDVRAPWYGPGATNKVRDQADLHEAWVELLGEAKHGFGLTVGRMMLSYGDGRIIGVSQWTNTSRTYDTARLYYRIPQGRLEVLFVSQVPVRIGEFNRPALGDRLWGTYDSFPNVIGKNSVEVYVLRREQNRPGGFTGGTKAAGTDKLGITAYGTRLTGPAAWGAKYVFEGVLESGKVGPADLRAGGAVATLSRRWTAGHRPLDISGEYKYASGTSNPSDTAHTATFDQLYAANHDKFGHQDLFGWRNIHNARSLATFGITRALALNFMYDDYWLASAHDGLYNGSGSRLVRSATGTAGRHVGRETDVFATYKYQHFTFGAGYGHLFLGEFLRNTTPGVAPTYLYIFHTYSL